MIKNIYIFDFNNNSILTQIKFPKFICYIHRLYKVINNLIFKDNTQ